MKISYSNNPMLEKLHKGQLSKDDLIESIKNKIPDNHFRVLSEDWKKNSGYFRKEIDYICESFREATEKAQSKITEVSLEMMKMGTFEPEMCGTYIESGGFTYMFRIVYDERRKITFTLYCIDKNKIIGFSIVVNNQYFSLVGDENLFIYKYRPEPEYEWCMNRITRIIFFYYFKKYAEVDIKIIPPNSRVKTSECKYVNDTSMPITYLDSKWFTTLVKSDSFTVHGHFRFQACGKDLKDHKFIWISEYVKSGYTSPARILKQGEK